MKEALRQVFTLKRDRLNFSRQKEGEQGLTSFAVPSSHQYILSYSSFRSELKTTKLNAQLAKQGRLVLPKVEGSSLDLFLVTDIKRGLQLGKYQILEPNPSYCLKISLSDISFALIPGVAFDGSFSRLGYGQGYYDRLLERAPNLYTVGVGFKEQLSTVALPQEAHDKQLNNIQLF
ncbi:MAG: 5-formyltetrahydrofolate cyclo-ligase [Waddliaceae bacterium]